MSRALLVMALAKTIGRPPTDAERSEYLAALASLAGGEYLYIPLLPQSIDVDKAEIHRLRSEGVSIRQIAKKVGCSKSHVHRALSQFSPYVMDTEAA